MRKNDGRLLFLLCFLHASVAWSQIPSAKITFERKTNLYKHLTDWDEVKDYIKERDRVKTDEFELLFNDSLSLFRPVESDLREDFSWATEKNTVYQDLHQKSRLSKKYVWGESVLVRDTLFRRIWKITDSKRNICGYTCRKAVWQANDSTRIYAWYSMELSSGFGPESFYGLPGTILGLAVEDGSVIYFAKKVEVVAPKVDELLPPRTKEKIYDPAELRSMLEKQYGKERWGKSMIRNLFGYW